MRVQIYSAYIPFGGGSSLCPGRHLAVYEIIQMCAVLLQSFDIVIAKKNDATATTRSNLQPTKVDVSFERAGLGILAPAHPTPFKIRRKCSNYYAM